jgi:hypothetical protein
MGRGKRGSPTALGFRQIALKEAFGHVEVGDLETWRE